MPLLFEPTPLKWCTLAGMAAYVRCAECKYVSGPFGSDTDSPRCLRGCGKPEALSNVPLDEPLDGQLPIMPLFTTRPLVGFTRIKREGL